MLQYNKAGYAPHAVIFLIMQTGLFNDLTHKPCQTKQSGRTHLAHAVHVMSGDVPSVHGVDGGAGLPRLSRQTSLHAPGAVTVPSGCVNVHGEESAGVINNAL